MVSINRRPRYWLVVPAAAAIATVLVLARHHAAPAEEAAPALSSALPRVPYTVADRKEATLHDGDRTVKVPSYVDSGFFFGRVGDGWLGIQWPEHSKPGTGILQPDGTFRAVGPEGAGYPTPSPDRKQFAVVDDLNGKGEVVVMDVKSGKEVSRTVLPNSTILGWNHSGLWFSTLVAAPQRFQLQVWEPGSGEPRAVAVPDFDGRLSAPSRTDVISVSTRSGNTRCLRAGSLRDGRFEVVREYCHEGTSTLFPVLSTDGKTMLHSELGLAIDVASGKVTKLQVEAPLRPVPPPVFEYSSQVLVITAAQQVARCDVTTGECKVVLADAAGVSLHQP
jgi:hypothetical protein